MKDNFPDTEPVFARERAQPAEGPRETEEGVYPRPKCEVGYWPVYPAPVEGVERVTDKRVRTLKPMTDRDACVKLREIFDDLQTRFYDQWDWMDAEFSLQVLEAYLFVERVTDDRPAETIPDTVILTGEQFREMKVAAETRIEVLEAALRGLIGLGRPASEEYINEEAHRDAVARYDKACAAMAAPSGEKGLNGTS